MSFETARGMKGGIILYINTGIFMRSVDLFFCLSIRLTISSLSEEGQKNEFSTGSASKIDGEIFE